MIKVLDHQSAQQNSYNQNQHHIMIVDNPNSCFSQPTGGNTFGSHVMNQYRNDQQIQARNSGIRKDLNHHSQLATAATSQLQKYQNQSQNAQQQKNQLNSININKFFSLGGGQNASKLHQSRKEKLRQQAASNLNNGTQPANAQSRCHSHQFSQATHYSLPNQQTQPQSNTGTGWNGATQSNSAGVNQQQSQAVTCNNIVYNQVNMAVGSSNNQKLNLQRTSYDPTFQSEHQPPSQHHPQATGQPKTSSTGKTNHISIRLVTVQDTQNSLSFKSSLQKQPSRKQSLTYNKTQNGITQQPLQTTASDQDSAICDQNQANWPYPGQESKRNRYQRKQSNLASPNSPEIQSSGGGGAPNNVNCHQVYSKHQNAQYQHGMIKQNGIDVNGLCDGQAVDQSANNSQHHNNGPHFVDLLKSPYYYQYSKAAQINEDYSSTQTTGTNGMVKQPNSVKNHSAVKNSARSGEKGLITDNILDQTSIEHTNHSAGVDAEHLAHQQSSLNSHDIILTPHHHQMVQLQTLNPQNQPSHALNGYSTHQCASLSLSAAHQKQKAQFYQCSCNHFESTSASQPHNTDPSSQNHKNRSLNTKRRVHHSDNVNQSQNNSNMQETKLYTSNFNTEPNQNQTLQAQRSKLLNNIQNDKSSHFTCCTKNVNGGPCDHHVQTSSKTDLSQSVNHKHTKCSCVGLNQSNSIYTTRTTGQQSSGSKAVNVVAGFTDQHPPVANLAQTQGHSATNSNKSLFDLNRQNHYAHTQQKQGREQSSVKCSCVPTIYHHSGAGGSGQNGRRSSLSKTQSNGHHHHNQGTYQQQNQAVHHAHAVHVHQPMHSLLPQGAMINISALAAAPLATAVLSKKQAKKQQQKTGSAAGPPSSDHAQCTCIPHIITQQQFELHKNQQNVPTSQSTTLQSAKGKSQKCKYEQHQQYLQQQHHLQHSHHANNCPGCYYIQNQTMGQNANLSQVHVVEAVKVSGQAVAHQGQQTATQYINKRQQINQEHVSAISQSCSCTCRPYRIQETQASMQDFKVKLRGAVVVGSHQQAAIDAASCSCNVPQVGGKQGQQHQGTCVVRYKTSYSNVAGACACCGDQIDNDGEDKCLEIGQRHQNSTAIATSAKLHHHTKASRANHAGGQSGTKRPARQLSASNQGKHKARAKKEATEKLAEKSTVVKNSAEDKLASGIEDASTQQDSGKASVTNGSAPQQNAGQSAGDKGDKSKYHNDQYTYQKLRSLKWFSQSQKDSNQQASGNTANVGNRHFQEEVGLVSNNQLQFPRWNSKADQEIAEQTRIKKEIQQKYNQLAKELKNDASNHGYRYILLKGNNHNVIKRVMETRPQWTKIDSVRTSLFDFKWSPFSGPIRFDFLGKHGEKNLVNHFEYHGVITQKDQLCVNLQKICDNANKDVFDLIPITFVVDNADQHQYHSIIQQLKIYFNAIEKNKGSSTEQINQAVMSHPNLQKRSGYTKANLTLRDCMHEGHNLWVLKPNDCNRGRGIHLFNNIGQLQKLISEYTQGKEIESKEKQNDPNKIAEQNASEQPLNEEGEERKPGLPQMKASSVIRSDVFVIQKYIERPLLIDDRKFDIRLWVLVTHDHKCFMFKEGYIRMSSYKYSCDEAETDEKMAVHLTNNAIQKYDKNYGQQEDGNILSYNDAQTQSGIDFYKLMNEEMLPIIEMTLMAARLKMNKNNRRFCFELFGYDFMIDAVLRPWLIEVNTNPCLEEPCSLLRQIIPRMIDDAFKLTLDCVYPKAVNPTFVNNQAKDQGENGDEPQLVDRAESEPVQQHEGFPVDGYPNEQNLWGDSFYQFRPPN